MSQLWVPSIAVGELVLRVTVVYVAVLLLLRIGGKKEVGQMGTAEFVAILLISNAVQNAMNGGDNSLTGGLVLAAVIVALSALVGYLTYRWRWWEILLQGRPTLLIHQGKVLERNLRVEQLSVRELRTLLRKQGIHELGDIQEAVLESDGFVSVIKRSEIEPGALKNPPENC